MTNKYRRATDFTTAAAALMFATATASAAEAELFKKTPLPTGYDIMKDSWDIWPESENLYKVDVAPNLYMIAGVGGNIAVLVSDDGVLLVDSGFPSRAVMEGRVFPAVKALGKGKPVKYVISSHHHGDHTGGNEYYGKLGAIIISGETGPDGMAKDPGPKPVPYKPWYPALKPEGRATVTTDSNMTLRFGNEFVRIIKLTKPGHSTSDVLVKFDKANVVHAGDVYFKHYFIPLNRNGKNSADYLIDEQKELLKVVDDRTKIMPGHSLGELANKTDVKAFNDMLVTLVGRVKDQIKAGKTEEQTVAMNLAKEFEKDHAYWSITGNQYVATIYNQSKP